VKDATIDSAHHQAFSLLQRCIRGSFVTSFDRFFDATDIGAHFVTTAAVGFGFASLDADGLFRGSSIRHDGIP
jgi:hypothetical protein